MDLKTVARGAPWMTRDERLAMRRLVRRMRLQCAEREVKDIPQLALRIHDLGIALTVAARMQSVLATPAPTDDDPMPPPPVPTPAMADAIGKAQERVRKALAEIEDHFDKYGCAVGGGLADRLKPILEARGAGYNGSPFLPEEPDDEEELGAPIDIDNPRDIPPRWEREAARREAAERAAEARAADPPPVDTDPDPDAPEEPAADATPAPNPDPRAAAAPDPPACPDATRPPAAAPIANGAQARNTARPPQTAPPPRLVLPLPRVDDG